MAQAVKLIPALSEKDKERFFSKIKINPETGCLEWTARRTERGYGQFNIGGKKFYAHRVMYFLSTGINPAELHTCHSCDNPSCVSFEHLWLGTNMENMRDKERKGRGNQPKGDANGSRLYPERRPRGEKHGSRTHPERIKRGEQRMMAKLKSSDIPLIRADTRYRRIIAAEYGVSQSTIRNIKHGKKWTHIA